ncbi:hypothetical protein [Deinococcus sp. QL22]|uniref:hypothetical protein n=1 Tax=Deinococcus sp. QL22 TaxID=2939437 RepID=UPI0020173011|nr:hypothetical protein [Deinococcus sp. QL22]UQN09507.1 hypothetical protein M1R55_23460 [Deinococcus sp. QL22]
MLGRDSNGVWVEFEGVPLQLTSCVDRYVAWSAGAFSQSHQLVEIWEDEVGHVIRLSKPLQLDAPWDAQAWI